MIDRPAECGNDDLVMLTTAAELRKGYQSLTSSRPCDQRIAGTVVKHEATFGNTSPRW